MSYLAMRSGGRSSLISRSVNATGDSRLADDLPSLPRGLPERQPALPQENGNNNRHKSAIGNLVLHDGELYKVVPHAQDCIFNQGASTTDPNFPNSCESGKFNAAGTSVKQ